MNSLVNYKKRGVELPKGCKDLSDVLKRQQLANLLRPISKRPIWKSKCDYCGAQASAGSASSFLASASSMAEMLVSEAHCWCEQCQHDLREFWDKPENMMTLEHIPAEAFGDQTLIEKLTREFEEIEQRREEFMRRKVAERKGPA